MNRLLSAASLAVMGLLLTVSAPAKAEDSPSLVVQRTGDAVTAVLADAGQSVGQKRHGVEAIVYEQFDFVTLSRLVLGRNWKQLSPEQQTQFVEEFRRHLSVTYSKNIGDYKGEKPVVTADRKESDGDWTVKSKIVRPGAEDVAVDYRLRQSDGRWKVIDVIVEGVSLVANFRSQFQEIVSKDGAPKLIDMLREKNSKGESFKSNVQVGKN